MHITNTPNSQTIRFTHIVPTISAGQYIALTTLTIAFWLLAHSYTGIWHDATLYTAQALKILYPEIYQEDIFFRYGSQANFTIYPELHALLIELIGVDNSAFLLTIIGQAFLFIGSITLARHFLTLGQTTLFLVIFTTLPEYTNAVLNTFELFVTSRSISAGLSLLFIAFLLNNRTIAASIALITALLLHPLIPLGAITIALFLQRPKVIFALVSLGIIFIIIGYLFTIPPISHLSLTIDNEWRNLVIGRASFLFIEYWQSHDLHLLLLEICILFSARAYCTDKLKSAFNAVLVAAATCMLIAIAASWLSNALLIQLQTWRILWLVHIFSAVALAWLISVAWSSDHGKLVLLLYCSIFLTVKTTGGLPALAVHSFWIWSLKRNPTLPPILFKGAYAILAETVFWYILNTGFIDEFNNLGAKYTLINNIKYFLKGSPFYITALLMALLLYSKHIKKTFSIYITMAILILTPIAISSFDKRYTRINWVRGNSEPYITLRNEIPESATVYCEQGIMECWFLLRRQQYMSQKQSAGIVFSRETAFEAKRRADLLFNAGFREGIFPTYQPSNARITLPEPTLDAFNKLCQDPELDYVITEYTSPAKTPDKIINTARGRKNIYYCSPMAIEHQLHKSKALPPKA